MGQRFRGGAVSAKVKVREEEEQVMDKAKAKGKEVFTFFYLMGTTEHGGDYSWGGEAQRGAQWGGDQWGGQGKSENPTLRSVEAQVELLL